MKYDVLKRLSTACINETNCYADGLNFGELYQRIEETHATESRFDAALRAALNAAATVENEALQEALSELDSVAGEMCSSHEEQGFCNGVRIAMMMMEEIHGKS